MVPAFLAVIDLKSISGGLLRHQAKGESCNRHAVGESGGRRQAEASLLEGRGRCSGSPVLQLERWYRSSDGNSEKVMREGNCLLKECGLSSIRGFQPHFH